MEHVRYRTPYSERSAAGHLVGMLTRRVAAGLVVDLGCGYAPLAEPLTAAGFTYVGVDLDQASVDDVAARGFEAHRYDLGATDVGEVVRSVVGDRRLVAVLAIDVVEHLPGPLQVLSSLSAELARHDAVLGVSIPNVAHADLAMKLLIGRWDVTAEGLLDDTHINLFDHRRLDTLTAAAGLAEIERQDFELERTEQGLLHDHPLVYAHTAVGEWLRDLRHRSDGFGSVYQFVRLYRPTAPTSAPALTAPSVPLAEPTVTVVLLGDATPPSPASVGDRLPDAELRVAAIDGAASLADVLAAVHTTHVVLLEPHTELPAGWLSALMASLEHHPARVAHHPVESPWADGMPTAGPLRALLLADEPLAAYAVPVAPFRRMPWALDDGPVAAMAWVIRTMVLVGVVDGRGTRPMARSVGSGAAVRDALGGDPLFLPAGWVHQLGAVAHRLESLGDELAAERRRREAIEAQLDRIRRSWWGRLALVPRRVVRRLRRLARLP